MESKNSIAPINEDLNVAINIDNKDLYHCGASIKDMGKKCFGINKIEDENIINQIIK